MKATIYCVKWGKKYSSKYVNRLYSMLKRHCSIPFQMYCYTDNPKGIRKDVNIIPITDDSKEGWWYKLDLLQHTESNCILFDLDVIILQDPIKLFTLETQRPTVIASTWKKPWSFYKGNTSGQKSTLYNSSILKWQYNQGWEIYDFFQQNMDEMMLRYSGIDRMLWNENDCEVDTLPEGITYSYWLGNKYPDDVEPEKYREGFEVCIFNHEPKMESVTGWPLDYWK